MNVEYERGDVVEASDPFDEGKASRPFVIVNTTTHPFAGDQYIALTLTTKTWYDETIPLSEGDFVDRTLPKKSFIVPWSISSPQREGIETYLGQLSAEVVDRAVEAAFEYVFETESRGREPTGG